MENIHPLFVFCGIAFLVAVVIIVAALFASTYKNRCPKGGQCNFRLVKFAVWGNRDWRQYEANWECPKCGQGRHRFAIDEKEVMGWFPDWKAVREALRYPVETLYKDDIFALRGIPEAICEDRQLIPQCMDCQKPYEEFGLDTTLPDEQWATIHPGRDGLLCANCIVARAAKLPHAYAVRATIAYTKESSE